MHHPGSTRVRALHRTRRWEDEEAVLRGRLHHHLCSQRPLRQTRRWQRGMQDRWLHQPKLRRSQDLPEARRERLLPAPIRMHRASNKVRRKLHEAHQEEEEEGLKGRRMESRCAGTCTPLHLKSNFIRVVIIHQQSSRVLYAYYILSFGKRGRRKKRKKFKRREKIIGGT